MRLNLTSIMNWTWLVGKIAVSLVLLSYSVFIITKEYIITFEKTDNHFGMASNIEGYWFERSWASSNTIVYGGGARILHIKTLKNGSFYVKFTLDNILLFEGDFQNRHDILQGNPSMPFGGGRKYIFIKSDLSLLFENREYIHIGKKADTVDILGVRYIQVKTGW